MDLEARSLQPNLKAMLLAKLREYKSDLNKLKKEVKKLTSGNPSQVADEELLEAGMSGSHVVCSHLQNYMYLSRSEVLLGLCLDYILADFSVVLLVITSSIKC